MSRRMFRHGCMLRALVCGGAALACLAAAAEGGPPDDEMAGKDDERPVAPELVEYKSVADVKDPAKVVKLRLHVFKPAGGEAGAPRPAIVFFFGGGWRGGSPGQFYPQCEYLASRGIVAMSAEYRVKSRNGTSPFECVKDGKSAIRYVRAHADELGVDPERIAAGGGSAGGHVAACTGVIEGHEEDGEGGEDAKVSSRADALALFNPVIGTLSGKGFGAGFFREHEDLSPAHNVRKGLPPTIIFHGKADTTVLFEDVERFTALMKEAGNDCTLVAFEGEKHGFFNLGRGDGFEGSLTGADRFLVKLGYIEGEPSVREFIAARPAKKTGGKRKKKGR